MAARSGMTTLINTVRGMTDAGSADYTAGTVTYWSDAEVERILDRQRQDFYRAEASGQIEYIGGGTTQYKIYYLPPGLTNIEETTAGTSIFTIEDADGDKQGTADWTMDYDRGVITFGADHGGTAYFCTGRTYNINAAASDIWTQKAANAAMGFDFTTDNHSVKRSQVVAQYREMAQYYSSLSGPASIQMYREDYTW